MLPSQLKIQENARLQSELADIEAHYRKRVADLESQLEASEREIQKNKDMLQHREKSANVRFYALSSLLSYRMVLEIHFIEIYRLKRKILFSQPFSVFVYIQRVSFPKVMTDYLPTGSC